MSSTDARIKARTTATKELIPHLLTLKDMTAVIVIKREGNQFGYDKVRSFKRYIKQFTTLWRLCYALTRQVRYKNSIKKEEGNDKC